MNQSPLNILVVEDEYDNQQMISRILTHYGYEVQIVANGIECLQALETMSPSVVIMDLAMPKMDGWETLVAIRTNFKTAHIPVVAITAFHSDEVARGAEAAGFDAYFRKPLSPTKFVADLLQVLGIAG